MLGFASYSFISSAPEAEGETTSDITYLLEIQVRVDRRLEKLGTYLMDVVKDAARARGTYGVFLTFHKKNPNIAFYRKHLFEPREGFAPPNSGYVLFRWLV